MSNRYRTRQPVLLSLRHFKLSLSRSVVVPLGLALAASAAVPAYAQDGSNGGHATPTTGGGGGAGSDAANGGGSGGVYMPGMSTESASGSGLGSSWGGGGRSSVRGAGGSSTGGGRGADGEAYPAWAGGGGGGAGGGLNSSGMGGGGGGGAAHGAEGGAAGGGGGGGGRLGLNIVASGALNSGTIAGGNGGDGGNGAVGPAISLGNSSGGGGGGGGGSGVLVAAGVTYTNQGLISGGAGGFGADGPENGNFHLGGGGGGGGGGAGILLGDGATFINSGSVAGGDGGNAVVFSGGGGTGIYAAGNVTITNSGTISGGLNGGSANRAIAVQFVGAGNSLTLTTGSVINGQINLSGSATTSIVVQNAGLEIDTVAIDYGGTLALSLLDDFAITGLVGGGGSLTASGAGQLSLNRVSFTGEVDLANTGGVILNADVAAAAGHTYGSAVVLADDLTLQSDNGSVSFASTVDGAHALTIVAANGTVDFDGAVGGGAALTSLTTNSATFHAGGSITAGQLGITATAGPILQSAAFSVAGSAAFDAQSSDITLTNAGNAFGGPVALTGRNVAIANSSALQLAASSIGGNFAASTGGATISQSGPITVNGATTLHAGAGDINLANAANSFGGTISATGGNIAIRGGGNLDFDHLVHAAGGNIAITAGGALTLPGSVSTTGTVLLAADGGAFATSGSLSGSTVTLRGRDGLILAHDITAAGGLDISSTAGNITQTAGVITGAVQGAASGDVSLTGLNMIDTVGNFTAGGDFTLSNGRALTISGPLVADGVSLDASSGIVVTGAIQSAGMLNIASGTDLRVGNGGTTGSIDAATVALAGALIYDRADATTFDGTLTGAGTFLKEGSGNLLFDGNGSAFTGETEVRSGSLIIGGAAGSSAVLGGDVSVMDGAVLGGHGTLSGDVELASGATLSPGNSIGTLSVQGNLTLNQGSRLAFEAGVPGASFSIPGSSDSVQVGGDLTVNGVTLDVIDAGGMGPGLYRVFTYGGTLTQGNGGLTLGTVPVGSELALQFHTGDRQINLLNTAGTTLNFWNANGLADATRGGGGSGTWSLGAPSWTDAEGSVTAGMQPAPGFAIFGGDAGTVTVDDIDGPVSASGLQFASNGYILDGDPLHLASGNGETPVIRVGDGTAAEAGYVATINAPLSGSGGFVKQGLGTLVLGGDSAVHSGAARAEAGTLIVNGVLGGVLEVAGGARAGGSGTIAVLAVSSGGTVAPGNSIGSLSVGSLNLASGSILEVEVDAAGNADRIDASGAVTIDGASMSVLAAEGVYAPLTNYTVLTSEGGITGTFANVTSNLAFLTPTLSYEAERIVLSLTRNNIAFGDVARTPNQRAVAGAVSTLPPTNVLFNALVGQDSEGARAAFDQLSGEIHPSIQTVLAEDGRLPREAVLDRLAWAGEGSGGWGRVFGNWGKSDGNGNAVDTRRKTGGLVMGVDASTPGGLRFGLAGGYTRTDVEVDARRSEAKVKSGHALAYAGGRFDALGIWLGLGYSRSDVETDRSVAIGSLNDRLEASYDGELLQAFGEVTYSFPLGGGTLSPFAGVSVVDVRTEGFVERGGPAALSVAKTDETIASSTFGARAETAAIGPVSLRATGAWQRVWGGRIPASAAVLSGATTSAVIGGVPLSRNSGILETDVVWRLGTAATLTAGYAGRLGGSAQDHAARATLTIAF